MQLSGCVCWFVLECCCVVVLHRSVCVSWHKMYKVSSFFSILSSLCVFCMHTQGPAHWELLQRARAVDNQVPSPQRIHIHVHVSPCFAHCSAMSMIFCISTTTPPISLHALSISCSSQFTAHHCRTYITYIVGCCLFAVANPYRHT